MSARQDARSLAAILNPGILARALDCEKHVTAHPYNPDATESIRKAGVSYRRQLADVAALIEHVLTVRDERVTSADMEAAMDAPIKFDLLGPPPCVFRLGGITLGGRVLFETPTETCIMLHGDWATARIPRLPLDTEIKAT